MTTTRHDAVLLCRLCDHCRSHSEDMIYLQHQHLHAAYITWLYSLRTICQVKHTRYYETSFSSNLQLNLGLKRQC